MLALAWLGALAACGPGGERAPSGGATTGAAPGPAAGADCGGASSTLTGDGIGALTIGASVQSVRERCQVVRDTTVADGEGFPQRRLVVRVGDDTVVAEVTDDQVWRLQVTTRQPRTADSLGVGTPLERVLALPDVRGLRGEGSLFVVSPRHCGLSFQLSESGMDQDVPEWTVEALRRLPPSTVVTRVLVVGCSAAVQPSPS